MVLPYPKPAGRARIRVEALAVILDAACERIAVTAMSSTEQPVFHRPPGGRVAVGEHSRAAVVRHIAEELDATLVEPELLGVLESIFTMDAETGHEVVFVYAGQLLEREAIPTQGRTFWDSDEEGWVEWRPAAGRPDVPLFPTGLQELVECHLATRQQFPGSA